MTNNPISMKFRRPRRGVGAIIGGVILAAILLTTVLVYFITILNNEKARSSYEFLALQASQDKSAEKLTASRDPDLVDSAGSLYIHTRMSNNGSLPLIISRAVMYCVSVSGCPSPNNPLDDNTPITLNPGEPSARNVGPVSNTLTYRVDFITERGNIVTTKECTVDTALKTCVNDDTSGVPDFSVTGQPHALAVVAGNTATIDVIVGSVNGFSSPVTLSFSVSPATGMATPNLSPGPVTPPNTSQMTIATTAADTPGTYVITITGTSGSDIRSDVVSVTVVEPIDDVTGLINEGIIQGTGSLQLDFKAFGAIYPQLASRDGVEQTGWLVKTTSRYGSATGYPAYDLQAVVANKASQAIIVEKMRNLDPSEEDILLSRNTGLIINNDQVTGSTSSSVGSVYLCKETGSKSVQAYNEATAYKIIPWTDPRLPQTEGWVELYFCSADAPSGTTPWVPFSKSSVLNGIFLIARGSFTSSDQPYGQTIPYQAVTQSKGGINPEIPLSACLRDADVNTACPNPNTADDITGSLQYKAQKTDMQSSSRVTVYLHLNNGVALTTPNYKVSWLYPDGNSTSLADTNALNSNGNIELKLPRFEHDGTTPIGSDCSAGSKEYSTIIFTDTINSTNKRYSYYITFEMDC